MYKIELQKALPASAETIFKHLSEQDLLTLWFADEAICFPAKGTVAAFAIEPDINFKMKLSEFDEPKHIQWTCIDGNINWLESVIDFKIEEIDNNQSILYFSHSNINNGDKIDLWTQSWTNYLDKLAETLTNQKEIE